MKKSIY